MRLSMMPEAGQAAQGFPMPYFVVVVEFEMSWTLSST
jgi:hypothetical protein